MILALRAYGRDASREAFWDGGMRPPPNLIMQPLVNWPQGFLMGALRPTVGNTVGITTQVLVACPGRGVPDRAVCGGANEVLVIYCEKKKACIT